MSSNKTHPVSLKIRMALIYTLLFFISCSIIFSVAAYHAYREINNTGDDELKRIAENVRAIHEAVLNQETPKLPDDISGRKDYPVEDLQILQKRFPGMLLISASREEATTDSRHLTGAPYFTAVIWYKKNYLECRVREDRSIYSKRLKNSVELDRMREKLLSPPPPPPDPKISLRRRFHALARSYGQNDFIIVLWPYDADKPLLSAGKKFENPQQVFKQRKANEKAFEVGSFRYICFDIKGLGTLITGRSITGRDALLRRCLVIFCGVLLSVTGAGIAVAWLIARRFIGGIKRTTLAMKSIRDGDYSYRIEDIPYTDEEIKTLMETFNAMNERTEKLLNEIKMMSDNVAHDLRTPLTRISGAVELLLNDRELDEKTRNVSVSVLEETLRLKALVNTIMDISRTTTNPDYLKKELLDAVTLLTHFCDFMLPGFEEKSLNLDLELPPAPVQINADKTMFQRMLANLVENALKFTEHGGVTISFRPSGDGFYELIIRDSGCGIAAKDIKHIFDRFYRADASRHLSGNGLGLALVKAVVDAHNWKLKVDSTPGKGTAFIITIPVVSTAEIK